MCNDPCVCFFSGVHEFPEDIFTNQERMEGAVALHIMGVSVCVCGCVCLCVFLSLTHRLRQMQEWPVFTLMQAGAGDQI